MRYEYIEHEEHLLYRDRVTGEYLKLEPGPTGSPQLKSVRVRFVPKQEVLQLPPPTPVLQIPRYSTMRDTEGIPKDKIIQSDPAGKAIGWIKKIPFPFRVAAVVIVIIIVCSNMVVISHPKIVQTIIPVLAPPMPIAKATDRLTRISQLDSNQYELGQFDPYSASACSAASIAAVLNSYGAHYKVGQILAVEIDLGVISSSAGLTDISGVARTLEHFGFTASPVSGLSEIASAVSAGSPVIADLPPGLAWPSGHFLVVAGTDDTNVRLADSWITNYKSVSRTTFSSWVGKAWKVTPSRYSVLQGNPTVSASQIDAVLTAYHSPFSAMGQEIVDMGIEYGIDPSYVIATAFHESTLGTRGVAVKSHSPGNLRCADWITWGRCVGGYTYFSSWKDGFRALYVLLAGSHYVGAGRTTPEGIIPMFAPSSDGNDPSGYIASVKHSIDVLRSGGTSL